MTLSITDDDLLLYYYEDGLDEARRQTIGDAIAVDPALGSRYRKLCGALERLAEEAPPALPSDRLERFHDALDRAADRESRHAGVAAARLHVPSFFWGTALVAALAIGVALGVQLGSPSNTATETGPASAATLSADAGEHSGALMRGIRVHLRDSREGLAGLGSLDDADRVLLIADMIRQNRVFESAAVHQGEDDLARVLRAFELVLARLAEEQLAPSDADALRTQLSLEMNAMLTKLAPDTSNSPGTRSERT